MDTATQMRLTGLATGLDTDLMIENLGKVHKLRIDSVKRQKQLAVWRQEAYRNTINIVANFQKSSFNLANPSSNFRSANAFAKFSYKISVGGIALDAQKAAAAKVVSVTANGDLKNFNQKVDAVAQLASKDTWSGESKGLNGVRTDGLSLQSLMMAGNDTTIGLSIDGVSRNVTISSNDVLEIMANYTNRFLDTNSLGGIIDEKGTYDSGDGRVVNLLEQIVLPGTTTPDPAEPSTIREYLIDNTDAFEDFLAGGFESAVNLDDWLSDIDTDDTGKIDQILAFLNEDGNGLYKEGGNVVKYVENEHFAPGQTPADRTALAVGDIAKLIDEKIAAAFGKEYKGMVKASGGELVFNKPGSNLVVFDVVNGHLARLGLKGGASSSNSISTMKLSDLPGMEDFFTRYTPTMMATRNHFIDVKGERMSIEDLIEKAVKMNESGEALDGVADADVIDALQNFLDDPDSAKTLIESFGHPVNDKIVSYLDNVLKELEGDDYAGTFGTILPNGRAEGDRRIYADETTVKPVGAEEADRGVIINGEMILFSSSDTLTSVMNRINTSNAGVTLSYDSASDKFVLQSKTEGVAGNIDLSQGDFTKAFFEVLGISEAGRSEGTNLVAVINGTEFVRQSNTFTYEGMTYTFHSTYNMGVPPADSTDPPVGQYDENGIYRDADGKIVLANPADAIHIDVDKNTAEIVDSIKAFIDEYNKVIEHINGLINSRKSKEDKEYGPLTDEEKKAMTEDEVKQWEERAKIGLLTSDSDLRKLLDQMRSAIYQKVEGVGLSMADIGIGTAPMSWNDGGKLVIDETKLTKALNENYDEVVKLFTQTSDIPATDTANSGKRASQSGIAQRLNDIFNNAVGTTGDKGYLIKKAGTVNDASNYDNVVSKQIQKYDERIAVLLERWQRQEKNYIRMFARMETAMSKMTAQQNSLASLMAQNGG